MSDDLEREIAEVEEALAAWERLRVVLGAAEDLDWQALHLACDEITRLRQKLEAAETLLGEVAIPLYFGFMICEHVPGKGSDVRITFADLQHAQRLHRALVGIQTR